jgi:hypothetical protein
LAEPLRVAVVVPMLVAASVVTVGTVGAVNDSTDPTDVPAGFWARAQK